MAVRLTRAEQLDELAVPRRRARGAARVGMGSAACASTQSGAQLEDGCPTMMRVPWARKATEFKRHNPPSRPPVSELTNYIVRRYKDSDLSAIETDTVAGSFPL